jgi:integrase
MSDTDRTSFLAAAMTGLRQGELLGLPWQDVDWTAGKTRVRGSYVRGHWGTPKSRRASRAVPMADRLAGELDRHYKRSSYKADDDLVFGHPQRGSARSITPTSCVASNARFGSVACVRCAFTTCAIRLGRRWPSPASPMHTLQEWMGHRDFKTTLIYADYAPSGHEAELIEHAFGKILGPNWAPASSEAERRADPR